MIIKNITGAVDSWMEYDIRKALNESKGEAIKIVLTSNGGNVAKALAISDMFKSHGNVIVEFSGVAASAATWLAYGASKVVMHNDTLWLCHQSSTPVVAWENMNADELEAFINKLQNEKKSLEVIDAIIAKKYLDRCSKKGKNLKDVTQLMKEERYLSPSDCLEWGFVDEIIEEATASNVLNQTLLKDMGLPVVEVKENNADPINEDSMLNRIYDRLKMLFNTKTEENISIVMNKKFEFVNNLLKIEGVEENDGKVTINVEQLSVINESLKEKKEILDKLKGAEKEIDKVSDKIAGMTGLENKIAALSLIIDHMPVGTVLSTEQKPGSKSNEKETVEVEDADEVNEFVKSFK